MAFLANMTNQNGGDVPLGGDLTGAGQPQLQRILNDPNAAPWDYAMAVYKTYGEQGLNQLQNNGYLAQRFPSWMVQGGKAPYGDEALGKFIAARESETAHKDDIFGIHGLTPQNALTIGGLALGGMGLAGAFGAEAGAGLSGLSATDAAALGDSYGVASGAGGAAAGAGGATFAGQPMGNSFASAANMTDAPITWDSPPPTGGGMTNSIMNNPWAGGAGGTGGVDLSAAGLGSSGVPIGTSGLGTGAGSLMGDAAAGGAAAGASEGGDIWSTINNLLGPTAINGVTGAGLLGAGINYLTQNRAAGQYGNLANTVRQSGSALYDPQRTPYQSNLSNLVNNPSQYMANDPFAQALTAQYKNNVIPRNVAASGNPASVLDEKGSQFANALAGNYNTQVGQMSGIAGFGFPPSGYTPSAVGAAGSGAIGAQATGIGGLANLFGQNFAQPPQGTSGTKGIFGTGVS